MLEILCISTCLLLTVATSRSSRDNGRSDRNSKDTQTGQSWRGLFKHSRDSQLLQHILLLCFRSFDGIVLTKGMNNLPVHANLGRAPLIIAVITLILHHLPSSFFTNSLMGNSNISGRESNNHRFQIDRRLPGGPLPPLLIISVGRDVTPIHVGRPTPINMQRVRCISVSIGPPAMSLSRMGYINGLPR